MNQEKKHNIALMRYGAIAQAVSGLPENYMSFEAFFRDVAEKGIKAPDGRIRHYAPGTIKTWYHNYMNGGFDALMPHNRDDEGRFRKLDEDLKSRIHYLKTTYPRMSASAIYRQLKDNGLIISGEVSESTVNRYVNRIKAEQGEEPGQGMRRYERAHINEVWCGDSSVGPYLKTEEGKRQKVYIIALIDDASRFIVGIDVFFNDNFVNLMSVIRSAVSKYGRPQLFNFDNGKNYRNKQMELLAARIGSVIHFDQPYTPTQKAKIERWFRTMKDQWMSCIDTRDFRSLDELRGSLLAYVKRYNQSPHSSLGGMSPQDRFFSEGNLIHRLTDEEIAGSFLLEIERKVSADSVIKIDQVEYEVDCRFARQRIRLRYSPDLKEMYVVEADGTLSPIRVLNKRENAYVKRERVHLSGGDEID